MFLLAGPIARLMHHGDIEGTLRWISVLLLTGGLSRTHETWLMKHLQFKVLALRSLVAICIGGGVGIVMAVNGYGLLSLIAQQLITSVIGTVCLWLVTTWRPGFDTRWENIASLLRYSRHLSLAAVAAFADGQSDVFFSSWYLGPAATGVYNAAKRILIAIAIMFSSGLNSVALPAMAAISKDHERASRGFLKAVSLTTLLTAPLYAGLAALSPDFIHILMGDKWYLVSVLALDMAMLPDMPGWHLCAATRPKTAVFDHHLVGLALEFQPVVLGLGDKFAQLLHQNRPVSPVVEFPRLLTKTVFCDPARR